MQEGGFGHFHRLGHMSSSPEFSLGTLCLRDLSGRGSGCLGCFGRGAERALSCVSFFAGSPSRSRPPNYRKFVCENRAARRIALSLLLSMPETTDRYRETTPGQWPCIIPRSESRCTRRPRSGLSSDVPSRTEVAGGGWTCNSVHPPIPGLAPIRQGPQAPQRSG